MDCICKILQKKTKTLITLLISNVTKKSFWWLVVVTVGLQSISCPSHPPSLKFFDTTTFCNLVHSTCTCMCNCVQFKLYIPRYICIFVCMYFWYNYIYILLLVLHTARCYHVKLQVLSYLSNCFFFFCALHQFCVYGHLWSNLNSWRVQC